MYEGQLFFALLAKLREFTAWIDSEIVKMNCTKLYEYVLMFFNN